MKPRNFDRIVRALSVPALATVLLGSVGCGGGSSEEAPAANTPVAETPGETPPPAAARPEIAGELIGLPGDPVPGLDATYVTTTGGWLGATEDEVVFEAVIQWSDTKLLGCGILRRAPDGNVSTVLMQDQRVPGGAGFVRHPRLPLQADAQTLLIPAEIVGGAAPFALFAVDKATGAARVLAADASGRFVGARFADDGSVLAEVDRDGVHAVLRIEEGTDPFQLCAGCAPGFSTDGETIVVHDADTAWRIEFDGTAAPVAGAGDPAPGTAGMITAIRDAWTTPDGTPVVHANTDDPARPETLWRIVDGVADAGRRLRHRRTRHERTVRRAPPGRHPSGRCRLRRGVGRRRDEFGCGVLRTTRRRAGAAVEGRNRRPRARCRRPRTRTGNGRRISGWTAGVRCPDFRGRCGGRARRLHLDCDGRQARRHDRRSACGNAGLDARSAARRSVRPRHGRRRTLVYAGWKQDRRPDSTLHALILVR